MLTLPPLNRRHKAGLFLVVVGAGLSLSFEASAKQTTGIVLLGLAATWLIGALSLRVLWLLSNIIACGLGVYFAGKPVLDDWNSVRDSAQDYDRALSDIRQAIASSEPPLTVVSSEPLPGNEDAKPVSKTEDWFARNAPRTVKPKPLFDMSKARPVDRIAGIPGTVRHWERPCSDLVVLVRPGSPAEQPKTGLAETQEHGPWEKSWKPVDEGKNTLVFNDKTKQWSIPMTLPPLPAGFKLDNGSCGYFAEQLSFPADTKPEELFTTLRDQVLRPRPRFSVWQSLGSNNRRSSIVGIVCFAAGLFSFACLLRSVRLARRRPSPPTA